MELSIGALVVAAIIAAEWLGIFQSPDALFGMSRFPRSPWPPFFFKGWW